MKASLIGLSLGVGLAAVAARADTPVTLENVVNPGPNEQGEPVAAALSLDAARRFLDSAALSWQREQQCFTCHTNYAYLYARPALGAADTAHRQVRAFAEELVSKRWPAEGPRWDAEVVSTAAALAFNDSATSGQLHPLTRTALDRIWTVQKEHGGFDWIKCDWPPLESDDHYGATLAAIAVGVAPEDYAHTPAAQQGLAGLRRYLANSPPPTLHHRGMLLWAGSYLDDLQTAEEKAATIAALRDLQRPDGGWALASLGDWTRENGSPQDRETSDGYGTGFVLYVLRRADVPANDAAIERGIAWLKTHQRQSGRWYTRSLHADSEHYITHAGTAMAVMALTACGEDPATAPK